MFVKLRARLQCGKKRKQNIGKYFRKYFIKLEINSKKKKKRETVS